MFLGVGPDFGSDMGQKLIGACQGGWGSSQCGPFNFLWPFGRTNEQNSVKGAFLGKISVLYPIVLGVEPEFERLVG